jgi:hypothetical protein
MQGLRKMLKRWWDNKVIDDVPERLKEAWMEGRLEYRCPSCGANMLYDGCFCFEPQSELLRSERHRHMIYRGYYIQREVNTTRWVVSLQREGNVLHTTDSEEEAIKWVNGEMKKAFRTSST